MIIKNSFFLRCINLLVLSIFVIKGATVSAQDANWLAGSWGVSIQMDGGKNLVPSQGYEDVAQQVVNEFPTAGHVFVTLTHMAHGYYFTLRDNPNVDIATDIHPDFVPSIEDEQITFNVLNTIRNSGKKIMMYIATDMTSKSESYEGDLEYQEAWEAYYNEHWDGDEAAAYQDIIRGFVSRLQGQVDGYWLDHIGGTPGGWESLVGVIRDTDPTVSIAVNGGGYLAGLEVASDGVDDTDSRSYNVRSFATANAYGDFIGGHPTPLGLGAPPNSWAYEEFSFTQENFPQWAVDENSGKTLLSHAFLPVRERWTPPQFDLVLTDPEQAYRIVRSITDRGAAVTFAMTDRYGALQNDELAVFRIVNERMAMTPKPAPLPYARPNAAYLVSELQDSLDIGEVGAVGRVIKKHDTNTYVMTASGADIWNTADEFHFLNSSVGGDFDASVKVTSLEDTNTWAKAGIMVRDGLDPDAKFIMALQRPDNLASALYRESIGGNAVNVEQNVGGTESNKYLRLKKTGDTYTAYYSVTGDNDSWIQIGEPQTILFDNIPQVGLAATSHDDGVIATVVFDDYQILRQVEFPWVNDDLVISGSDLKFTTHQLDISDQNYVNLSFDIEALGAVDSDGFLQVYYTVDGGEPVEILNYFGEFDAETINLSNIVGDTLEIIVHGYNSWAGNEFIYLRNLRVTPVTLPEPVAYWSLDDASGVIVTDDTNNGHDGELVGGEWNGEETSVSGSSISLDGGASTVKLPNSAFETITEEITISMWIYRDIPQSVNDAVFYANDINGDRALHIMIPFNGRVYWDAGNEGSLYDRISVPVTEDLYEGRWNHWVFTKNTKTGEMVMYVNGSRFASGSGRAHEISNIDEVFLGSRDGYFHYQGIFDEIRVYDIALSSEEVRLLHLESSNNYGEWLSQYPSIKDLDKTHDPDSDGVPTVLEYILGGNPLTMDSLILPQSNIIDDQFIYTFERRSESIVDTDLIFQYSNDMVNWSNLDISEPTPSISIEVLDSEMDSITIELDISDSESSLYGRLLIE